MSLTITSTKQVGSDHVPEGNPKYENPRSTRDQPEKAVAMKKLATILAATLALLMTMFTGSANASTFLTSFSSFMEFKGAITTEVYVEVQNEVTRRAEDFMNDHYARTGLNCWQGGFDQKLATWSTGGRYSYTLYVWCNELDS